MTNTELWEEVLNKVSQKISKTSFDTWITPTCGIFEGNTLIIEVKNDFAGAWIEERYNPLFLEILKEITGEDFKLRVKSLKSKNTNQHLMSEEEAIGYMLLACKQAGLSLKVVKQLHGNILSKFKSHNPQDAEKEGFIWIRSLEETNMSGVTSGQIPPDVSDIPRRSANIKLPKIGESHYEKKLRAQNYKIIRELERMQNGTFGLCAFFRRINR